MARIDLDDVPPRVAEVLANLAAGEELLLVRGGAVVGRLHMTEAPAAPTAAADLPPEEGMKEILEQFNAMIHDEF
jgi:antitoxin (DNA-binding transcriptional repressor) of toxin-antitoxin stability system